MDSANEDTTKFCINSGINYLLMECDKYNSYTKREKCKYYTSVVNSFTCQSIYKEISSNKNKISKKMN